MTDFLTALLTIYVLSNVIGASIHLLNYLSSRKRNASYDTAAASGEGEEAELYRVTSVLIRLMIDREHRAKQLDAERGIR